jgi:hypothetical protein
MYFCFCVCDRVSLCSPGWPLTHDHVSVFWVPGSQARTTMTVHILETVTSVWIFVLGIAPLRLTWELSSGINYWENVQHFYCSYFVVEMVSSCRHDSFSIRHHKHESNRYTSLCCIYIAFQNICSFCMHVTTLYTMIQEKARIFRCGCFLRAWVYFILFFIYSFFVVLRIKSWVLHMLISKRFTTELRSININQ